MNFAKMNNSRTDCDFKCNIKLFLKRIDVSKSNSMEESRNYNSHEKSDNIYLFIISSD